MSTEEDRPRARETSLRKYNEQQVRARKHARELAAQMTKEQREALHNKPYREMTMLEQEAFKDDWLNDRIPQKPLKRIHFPGDRLYL